MKRVVARQVTSLKNEITNLWREIAALNTSPSNAHKNNNTTTRNNGPAKPTAPATKENTTCTTSKKK